MGALWLGWRRRHSPCAVDGSESEGVRGERVWVRVAADEGQFIGCSHLELGFAAVTQVGTAPMSKRVFIGAREGLVEMEAHFC